MGFVLLNEGELLIPLLVHQIVLGIGMCLRSDGFRAVLDLLCRDACPYSRFENLIRRNDGARSDDRTVRYDRIVHDDGSHTDDHVIADDTAMDIGPMADRNVVADDTFRLLICSMKYGVVLNVDAVADMDGPDVPAQHGSVPYAAVVSDLDCSDYCRRLRQKRTLSDDGHIAPEFLDYCHMTNVSILLYISVLLLTFLYVCKNNFMKKYFIVAISFLCALTAFAQNQPADTSAIKSISSSRVTDVIGKLNEFDVYWEHLLDKEHLDAEKISVASDIKSARINYWAVVIAAFSALIALFGAVVTCGTFIFQYRLGRRQMHDISKERYENRLFGYLDQYRMNVENFRFDVIGKGRPVFNYIFYEYQALYQDFCDRKFESADGKAIDKDTLSGMAISIVLNGLTRNSDGSSTDLIYDKYRDLVPLDVYESMKDIVDSYKRITDDELKGILAGRPKTLFINYGKLQLAGEAVPWFYGCRAFFMPYVRTAVCLLDLIASHASKDKTEDFKIVSSVIGDHELAILNAFANSRDNNVGLDKEMIDIFMEISHMPDMYNYKKW